MSNWQTKEFAKLTGVSVRTLHYYDKIDLLKPSIRQANSYRLYSETDLLRLQQIIALKFFGFELAKIKFFLEQNIDMHVHFKTQAEMLEEQGRQLLEASNTLTAIINDYEHSSSVPWEKIINLIEVYRMKQELEQTWAGKALNPTELEQYAELTRELENREDEKASFEQNWAKVLQEITNNLQTDPSSEVGVRIGEKVMKMVDSIYGKKFASLRKAVWEKGFMEGNAGNEHGMTQEMVTWLDRAIDTYWRSRLYAILDQAGKGNDATVLQAWEAILGEMCGDEQYLKDEITEAAMDDTRVSAAAKQWLKSIS